MGILIFFCNLLSSPERSPFLLYIPVGLYVDDKKAEFCIKDNLMALALCLLGDVRFQIKQKMFFAIKYVSYGNSAL